MKNFVFALVALLVSSWAIAETPNAWSTQDYDFYPGDFSGDGLTDILFVSHSPNVPSGILLSDGTAPTVLGQTWASNYLGIPWSSDAYSVHVGDFNGDGKADIFLQASGRGDSYVLLTDGSGHITAISQTVPERAMGIAWSADEHHMVVGDFNGDGRDDLFLQPTVPGGVSAMVSADANGQFSDATPAQSWDDGYLGFEWSVSAAKIYAGDFNGDGRSDLLIQAQPIENIAADHTISFSYPSRMNGVVLAQDAAQPFSLNGLQSWDRKAFGVDWSPRTNNLVIADFNGDGRRDVFLQPLDSGTGARLVLGSASGPIFSTSKSTLSADVLISADAATLVPGTFSASRSAGILIQSATRKIGNFISKSLITGINTRAIVLPTLSATSVSMAGIGYPTHGTPASQAGRSAIAASATLTPTSAGRTAGQFSITPTGAATYNIPIWTPPGARQIEPHLALHYSSGTPDGPMGPGWSLTGLTAIVRCGKTWVSTGGAPAGVNLATTDDLCLDGNRLRLTSGTQGIAGSTYQTEIADFSLVTAYGSQGNGPQYFIVQGKDGRYYEYGNTTDSRIFASGATTPYAWALNKVRDRQNNNMVYTYTTGASALTLAKILYTATPATSNAAPYEVDFNYIPRIGGSSITQSVAGGTVSRTTQLDNVNVLASGTSVRKYQLGYPSTSTTTGRPLLQTVQECGGSAGTDCIRPTSISYQAGQAGWTATPSSVGQTVPASAPVFPIDLNGDGITDLVYPQTNAGNYQWYVRYGTVSGTFASAAPTGVTTLTTDHLYPADLAARGHQDLLYPSGGYWWRLFWNGTGLSTASTQVTLNAPSLGYLAGIADVNGDGLPDILWVNDDDSAPGTTIKVLKNITTPGGAVSFAAPAIWYELPTNQSCADLNPCSEYHVAATGWSGQSVIAAADFDGDGRADLLAKVLHRTKTASTYYWLQLFSTGTSFTSTNTWEFPSGSPDLQLTDWNGDGCTDVIWSAPGTGHWTVNVSDCTNHGTTTGSIDTLIPSTQRIMVVDYNGDGRLDLLTSTANTNWKVALSTGSGVGGLTDTGVPAGTNGFFLGDFNGDGLIDLGLIDPTAGYALKVDAHKSPGTPPDLATSISDGFNINFSPTYVPISQYNYTKYSDASFPDIDFQGPMYVVNQFSASDGTGGTYTNDFAYWGARVNLQGRGFEGFDTVRQHDSRSGIWTLSYYARQFPYIGGLTDRETFEPDAATYMSIIGNTYTFVTPGSLSGHSCSSCYFPYVSNAIAYNYEVTGLKKGGANAYISFTKTQYTYDTYGNVTDTLATTQDTDSAAPASPFNGLYWLTEIKNTITNDNSAANWCLGRPSTTTTTNTVPGQAAQTRTVGHTIDYANCRATVETIEPNDTRLKVTTGFGFDACGNTNSVSVVGLDQTGAAMTARVTKTNYSYATARCALPEQVIDALNQPTVTAYNYNFGLPTSTTDPNGIATSWLYDNFGRKTKETRPDSTYTTYTYNDCVAASCWGQSDLRFLVYRYDYNTAGTQLRTEEKFYDGLDRQRYEELNRVLGVWDVQVSYYDSLGRRTETTLPYSSASNGYHIYHYDIGNRLTEDDLYDTTGTFYRSTKMDYAGQTTSVTDPNTNTVTKVTDVAGNMRRVTDPSTNGTVAGTTTYTFDPFANLITLVDADSYSSSYAYNIRGFKTGSNDADTGNWTFTPNSLNELVSQKDAKLQITSFGYDLLGRMTSRTEPESTTPTQLSYGTSATAHNVGRITQVTKPDGYAESYLYDTAGRPQTVTYTEDSTNYAFVYAYNNLGSVDTITYPVSTSGYKFVLKDVYDAYGYLNQVKDNTAGTVFWTLNSANDTGLPSLETLGNGVQISTTYTPWTNEMKTRTEGSGGSTTNLQNLSYNWDLNGNLHQRIDNRQSLTEQFSYDSINRLLSSTLNGVSNLTLTYDAAGNINTKSDVSASAYAYDTVHKHAVKTAGSWSMTYDANGNMITRAGGSISYYSYNLPNTINSSGNSTQFFYGGSHQRWKQIASYSGTAETTHYIGGMLEIMKRGTGATEYRHQIPAGTGTVVYTRRTDGTNATYYATSDHLGSSDVVMDSSASVLARESFTHFGARRGGAWAGTPSSSDYTAFGNTTRKAFTGHEILDSVSLVHMNGRVYDPYLGRFLSPDSVVQSLGATQSINPYAYAWNDPLKYIDPSGHSLLGDIVGAIVGIAAAIFAPYLVNFIATSLYGVGLTTTSLAMIGGFAGGFVGAMISTGSLSAAFTSGLIGAATAGAFNMIGGAAAASARAGSEWSASDFVITHAAVGCLSGVASGGNCGRGAAAAALSEAAVQSGLLEPKALGTWGSAKGAAEAGLVGGASAAITGGKFSDGFSVSASGYLFNSSLHTSSAEGAIGKAAEAVGKWGLRLFSRLAGAFGTAVMIDEALQNYSFVHHYTTAAAWAGMQVNGQINASPDGFVYVTGDYYTDGETAQSKLALRIQPEGSVDVPVKNVDGAIGPMPVTPYNNQLGGGTELRVPHPVSISGARWVPFPNGGQ